MTKAILIAMIALAGAQAKACTIKGEVKKAEAKTVYFQNGERVSLKQLEKTGCKISVSVMSPEKLRDLKIADLKKKLAKLGVK